MDLCTRKIVGYSISPRPDFAQIRERMENAFGGREGKVRGALFHSDQGWQYQRKEFGDILKGYGRIQTMSRKGNCHDNSVMENFFGRLKAEMFYGQEDRYGDYGSLEKGNRRLHRMVQLKLAERVPPLEIASGGSFRFRHSLITYRYSVQVQGYRTVFHFRRDYSS